MHLASNVDIKSGIIGGVILGMSSSAMMYFTGRITGISGIFEGVIICGENEDRGWTVTYIMGMLTAGEVMSRISLAKFGEPSLLSPKWILFAGLLTGFGTRLGSGCTSGHGLCGLARRSPRSLAAVVTFMASGMLSAYVTRNTELKSIFYAQDNLIDSFLVTSSYPAALAMVIGASLFNRKFIMNQLLFGNSRSQEDAPKVIGNKPSFTLSDIANHCISFACGSLFGVGLVYSGMCDSARVLGFLDISGVNGWDPSLMGVMGGGVLVNLAFFHIMHLNDRATSPAVTGSPIEIKKVMKVGLAKENLFIDWKLLMGSALFGLGWGMAGLCPGPGIVSLGASVNAACIFMPALVGGIVMHHALFKAQ